MEKSPLSPRIGVCSWSLQPHGPGDLIASLHMLGIDACQLALRPLVDDRKHWNHGVQALQTAGVEILSGMLALLGEDYSTLETIRETGGVAQDDLWDENLILSDRIAGFAGDQGIHLVTFHAGFIPHDAGDPRRAVLLERVAQVADAFAKRGLEVALETGQETADTLLAALEELALPNLGVNFDPANMILYGMGDPVEALRKLAPHVRQIHIKDALPSDTTGQWGREVPVGKGAVDWAAFFEAAASLPGPVNFIIEREAGANREDDIIAAVNLIERHVAAAAAPTQPG